MEIRALAERVLYGNTLDDKLAVVEGLTDVRPGPAVSVPGAPGRPGGLVFARGGRSPTPADLRDDGARGHVLHQFANHELLALELMALALLRFPDAPPRFRRGLAETLRDEQVHLALYLDRMGAYGCVLGDVPASGFFWACLADVPDPAAFCAGMGLTLEQANLDFSRFWADAFRGVDDPETVAVLDRVYADEIRHVRLGLHWLRRLGHPDEDDYTAWTRRLSFPLTPARGRGARFDRAGRLAAGLEPAFVDRVEVARHSKGRPPRVLTLDPGVEAEVAGLPSPARLARDLGALPMWTCGEDDVVIAPVAPSAAFLAPLAAAGVPIPQFVSGVAEIGARPVARIEPWGPAPSIDALHDALDVQAPTRWDPAWRELYSKAWSVALLQRWLPADPRLVGPEAVGVVCGTRAEVEVAVAGPGPFVVKAPFSTAGRDRQRAGGRWRLDLDWVERVIAAQGGVVVEPWLERLADLSIQATVGEGRAVVDGLVAIHNDPRGRFVGAVVGPVALGLPPGLRPLLFADRWLDRMSASVADAVAAAAPRSFAGPVGIDVLVARTAAGPRVKPIVEVNPRVTMGRLALALRPRVARPAFWHHVTVAEARRHGFADLHALAASLPPPRLEAGRLVVGALPTTEARPDSTVWTVLRGP